MVALLQAMLSDRGDGNNDATYDVLFGISSTSTGATRGLENFENECKFGAAITASLLNLDSSDANALNNAEFISQFPTGWRYVIGPGESSLVDMMEEVAWALNGFFYFNSSGKLSFKPITAVGTFVTPSAALTESNILRMSPLESSDDESEIIHTFKIECNHDPITGKPETTINIQHPLTSETYRDSGQTLEVKRRGLYTNNGMVSIEEIAEKFNRVFARRQFGIRKYKVKLPWQYHTLVPGDIVSINHGALNNYSGGTLSSDNFEVASVGALDFNNGTFEIECHETWVAKPISPTVKVSSYSDGGGGGPFVFTLAASDKYTNDANPSDFFAVGWKIYLLDKSSSPTFSTKSAVLTISAKNSTSITTSAAPGFTPAAGDVIIQANYDDADNTTTNLKQSLAQRGYVFMADTGHLLGTANANADTWG
jgi:hypothetical protein